MPNIRYKTPFYILLSFAFIFIVGCEKEIDVDFPAGETVVVIEGYVENGQPPYVLLTRGIPFLSSLSPSEFSKYFINGADVRISDGTDSAKLIPYTEPKSGIVVYSLDTSALVSSLKLIGKVGKTYTLSVTAEGRSFSATTSILAPIKLDSVWVEPKPTDSNLVQLMCRLSDPAAQTNYYRGLTKRNSDPIYDTGFRSVYSDIIVNGKSFDFSLDRGKTDFANNDTADFDKYGFFERGDTIYVKWCSIDKTQYDFWQTFDSQSGSLANPFSAPLKIKTNIKGKSCTGVFASYGAAYDTLIVKK